MLEPVGWRIVPKYSLISAHFSSYLFSFHGFPGEATPIQLPMLRDCIWLFHCFSTTLSSGFSFFHGIKSYLFNSCIGVAWSALYSDSTRDHRKRVRGIKYAQLATLCSVNVITITEKASHSLEVKSKIHENI